LRQTGGSTAVCRCEEGQFWDTAIMKCGACPADTYSSTDNTLYDGEDPATAGIRTWCSPCVELTVSAPGSTSKDDCKPAYALLSATKDNNGFCSQSDENLPLIPILDAAECQTAADSLGLAVASAGKSALANPRLSTRTHFAPCHVSFDATIVVGDHA